MLKVEVYLPEEALEKVRDAVKDYCVSRTRKYTHCMSWFKIRSMWMPVGDANPYHGTVGADEFADEYLLMFKCREEDLDEVVRRIKENHPYEEAVIDVTRLMN